MEGPQDSQIQNSVDSHSPTLPHEAEHLKGRNGPKHWAACDTMKALNIARLFAKVLGETLMDPQTEGPTPLRKGTITKALRRQKFRMSTYKS